jgi:hypothetical protein|tara:strand:- start:180 stop:416 length:237 start_codon:yes stop_codon:yes gene_type:complete
MRVSIAVIAMLLLLALPDAGHACAVCFDSSDENRLAFMATTAFLTLLPLGMVTGAGLWLRKRVRQAKLEENDPELLDN